MRIRQGVKDTVRLMTELIGLLSRRFGWALMLGLALAVAALLLFAGLADEVLEGDTRRFDEAVRLAVHQSASPPLTSLMWVATSLGSVAFLVLVGLCAVLGFLKAGWRRAALFFAVTMAGAALLNMVLKLSFQRTRPAPFFDTPLPSSYSFPSGHALMSFCFYGALAAIITIRTRSRTGRVAIWTLAALLVALIVTPALSLMLLPQAIHEREAPVVTRLKGWYRRVLPSLVGAGGRDVGRDTIAGT